MLPCQQNHHQKDYPMKKILKKLTFPQLDGTREFGFLILRVAVGALFILIGANKLMAGPDVWTKVGSALGQFGITYFHTFFGLVAALTEVAGGLFFLLGFFTRISALMIGFTMVVATVLKLNTATFTEAISPMTMLVIMVCFLFAGGGPYSLDALLKRK